MSLEEIQIRKINSLADYNEGSLSYQNNDIDIIFNSNYCFFSSPNYDFDELNMKCSSVYKLNINTIIKILLEYLKVKSSLEIQDKFNIFNIEKKKTKHAIDYNSIIFNNSMVPSNVREILKNIPKELHLKPNDVFKLILDEVDQVNTDLSHNHYIDINQDPYNITVRLKYNSAILSKKLAVLKETSNYDYFELVFSLDQFLYPFKKPKISYVKPKIDVNIINAILNFNNEKTKNWNYTITLNMFIKELANKLEKHLEEFDPTIPEIENSKLDMILIELGQIAKISDSKVNIKLDLLTSLDTNDHKTGSSYWKSGTGFGTDKTSTKWNIDDYINTQKNINQEINNLLVLLYTLIKEDNDNINKLMDSNIFYDFIKINYSGLTFLEIESKSEIYDTTSKIIYDFNKVDPKNRYNLLIVEQLKDFVVDIDMLLTNGSIKEMDENKIKVPLQLKSVYETANKEIVSTYEKMDVDSTNNYKDIVKEYQFNDTKLNDKHRFYKNASNKPTQKGILRIVSEINSLRKNLPNNWDSSVLMRIYKSNLNLLSFVIIGPKDTPYHNGIFEFHAYFPPDYPNCPPKVLLDTTDGGKVRFNPNLYACGKVCLSLLGTWSGEQGESWNPSLSSFLQVIISIQSLIMVDNPYFNEPGYERSMGTSDGEKRNFAYKDNIRLQTIRVTMINQLKSANNSQYGNFIKEHFRLKQEEICKTVEQWIDESIEQREKMIEQYDILKKEFKTLSLKDIITL